jgi:hypothetical protein
MTPNGMLAVLRASGVDADVWQMGGNCGVIGVAFAGGGYATITPESGPWSYGDCEDDDMGGLWGLYHYVDGETEEWLDVDAVAYGDAVTDPEGIVDTVRLLLAGV